MIPSQMRMPICKRCNAVHSHFLEHAFSALCQDCHDRWIVETFAMSPVAQRMTDAECLDFLQQRRPELFERGVLPDYLTYAKDIAHAETSTNTA